VPQPWSPLYESEIFPAYRILALRDTKIVIEIVIIARLPEAVVSRIRPNSRATLGDRSFLSGNFVDNQVAQP